MIITLAFAYIYSEYIKKDAISKLAHNDARKTSVLVFETLYSAMQKGWDRNDINEIIDRLNKVDINMHVGVYRSPVVAELFGEIPKDTLSLRNNSRVARAMKGEEILNIKELNTIDYYYPVKAKQVCLKCHVNAQVDDVLGVISVSYPIEDLKISLSEIVNFFIIFFIIFTLLIFLAIFFELNIYLIKPIQLFSNTIKSITSSNDITKRVLVNDNIEELDSIKGVFNSMLDSIEYQFYNDTLTQLYNRRKLTEDLENNHNAFLILVNIDSFQEINDLYGDEAGDVILKEFAHFLQENCFKDALCYRLHSDEFALLCMDSNCIKEVELFTSMLSEKISNKQFTIDETTQLYLSATIGISFGKNLLANADTALKLAKKRKKNYLIYDDTMTMAQQYEKNLEWTKRLKQAIETDKIIPVFQAIVDTKTQQIVKYEALMRMLDTDDTLIAPIHFLELAKKNKLYHQLTKIMIEKTFNVLHHCHCNISINLSVDDILNKEIYSFILQKLKQSEHSKQIVFEIIESEGIENFKQVLEFIEDVKQYGVKISIDDFGTGYSNFEYLMKLKVDFIKIDGSMIKNIDHDINSQMVTETIVDFAQKMNIKTVAEFVHSKEVFEKIKILEVDYAQGYYFAQPQRNLQTEIQPQSNT
jgi:diguanylate cyclase (GGDEF)-like protein